MNKIFIVATALCYASYMTPTYAQGEDTSKKEKTHKEHKDKKGHDHENEDGHDHGKNKNKSKKKKHDHKSDEKHEEGEDDDEHGSHDEDGKGSEKSAVEDKHSEDDKHEHAEAKAGNTEAHSDHSEEEGGHGDEHGEANSKVGPNKGILEASEESGFKLSPEALKNFEIKTIKLGSSEPWDIPLKARMLSQNEVNIYRVRSGLIKRIDFNLVSKTSDSMKIISKDLKEGDEVIVHGIGFIRIAELAAFGGAPEGHSH